ncbi:hypothetical protein AZF37_07580 [endosymbiont 'TC1' of Trimyema compressum]|uniref:ABC transporter permease n=1 Tax=endosymbiont 'TC1' of Trimyema compressum TaxID=243899 RepID=UPI0007F0DC47|nr:ABC transporter permease [endosymbiont 'TC1' of Trimyema compressum]AMP21041.1 hypothetical protein AZF37_07580 [endosymbiont 'TC1' of Trimyema compressum]
MESFNKEKTTVNYDQLDDLVRKFQKIFNILVPVITVIFSLLVVSIIIKIQGGSIVLAYSSLFESAFGNLNNIGNSLNRAIPLIMTGLGIAIAARANIMNLGAEGQIIFGGIFATVVAVNFQGIPPSNSCSPLFIGPGFLGGVFWAFIPGYFNAKHNTNIIITAILLNDIAIGVLRALVQGPLKEANGFAPQSAQIVTSAHLPLILSGSRLHLGIAIALVLAIIAHFVLFRTPVGLNNRILGGNPILARHSGMNVVTMPNTTGFNSGWLSGNGWCQCGGEIMGSQHPP